MNDQDALDQLYQAVQRLRQHGCDLDYIQDCVSDAFAPEEQGKD